MDDAPVPRRLIALCMCISLVLHGATAGWLLSARDAIVPTAYTEPVADEAEAETPSEQTRLGIESSTRATITWLGFADPTPHRATESELDQAAFRMAPIGAPAPPGTPDPGEAPREPNPSPQAPSQPQTPQAAEPASGSAPAAAQPAKASDQPEAADAQDSTASPPDTPTPGPNQSTATSDENPDPAAVSEPATPEASDAAQPTPSERKEPNPSDEPAEPTPPQPESASSPPAPEATDPGDPLPPAKQDGAATRPGELSDRESTPTSKTIDLAIRNWGRPAAGEGIEIKTRHPQFPDTLAIFRRVLDATVLIRFGADGFVRDVRFETVTVNKKTIVRNTGSPEGDRVVLNCVYNWSASGKEIEALKELGPDATVTIRMEMRIRP